MNFWFNHVSFVYPTEIRVNAALTKQIEAIEDALGKEVYLFSLKTSRTQLNQHGVVPEEQE